jgi:hypothetical protein
MQAERHCFIPLGQATTHFVPSQVTVAPVTLGQGSQSAPQVITERLLAQPPLHMCWPAGQAPLPGPASAEPSAPPVPWLDLPASTLPPSSRLTMGFSSGVSRGFVHPRTLINEGDIASKMKANDGNRIRELLGTEGRWPWSISHLDAADDRIL